MQSDFNKTPVINVGEFSDGYYKGWQNIFGVISGKLREIGFNKKIVIVECYQGVFFEELLKFFSEYLTPDLIITSCDYFHTPDEILKITWPDVTDDRIFGYMTRLNINDLICKEKLSLCQKQADSFSAGTLLVFGYGASLISDNPSLLIYADMPRWEIQLRMRTGKVNNLGINNRGESFETKYKRGYFVDWRICDRHKKKLMHKWDFILDSTRPDEPRLLTSAAFKASIEKTIARPFSVVPIFDEGPWGGQWMKNKFNLDAGAENYAWCFNCIPEENSLMFDFGNGLFETPSINLVFAHPEKLLGEAVHARFGDEFPIRFDFLDTMSGGNLSLQVHPVTEYIQETFGMHYTQDESYYIIDAKEDAAVYLGLKEGIDPDEMIKDLFYAETNGSVFDDNRYVEKWPAKKHDHFLIPGGTVHCSGKNCLVLEISSTTYIFTFKLWDWGRPGLDGKPRPINIEHGSNVIQWDRTTSWTSSNLINRIRTIEKGDGWIEESTGLHEREFIETRRHWFTKKVKHFTGGGVNVLNLVEGKEIIVESPDGVFEPFIVHYAETFIVPASVNEYTIRPYGKSEGHKCATIKARVRT